MAKERAPKRTKAAADAGPTNGVIPHIAPELTPPAGAGAVAEVDAPVVIEDGASLAADNVEVLRSAVGRVDTSSLSVTQGLVGAARTDVLKVDRGAVGAAMADRVEVSRGYARSILARQVQFDRAAARVVIAANVEAKQSAVMFLIARRVGGEVRVLFDWRGALAFGAVAGVIFGLISRARRPRS